MHAVLVLLGLLLSAIVFLIVKVNLRHRRRTHNFDGQEIERHHSAEARNVRAANTSVAVHNNFVNGGNEYRPGRR
ncbi:hypothetical protein K388_02146 [Streptomyces sp. KhCrAH-43]|uniref:hypothetical protein n=1 Tax=Streptomyces TaxID=1883 RepID=UPI000362CA1A|nr:MULTISPECIES: hypothetical protein [unclassified Streptomyces]MYS35140.1 hypothetical protein [Streptomyces sp. SID4920]MYU47486.1 hypothetical protein [Streptomyces sp. SID7803]MYX65083.1 hypothetical protein [Streptomyces sp. SID8373]RAJ64949.1 hypothetical protein K388_02146 [Streptomyces sp. KhCrAH-43]